jgi:hypothetical protein
MTLHGEVFLRLFDVVALLEPVDHTASFRDTLLAGISRVAFSADFNADLGYGGLDDEFVAAGAFDLCIVKLRMYSLFHGSVTSFMILSDKYSENIHNSQKNPHFPRGPKI